MMETRPSPESAARESEYFSDSAPKTRPEASLADLMRVEAEELRPAERGESSPRGAAVPAPASEVAGPFWNRFGWSLIKLALPSAIFATLAFNYSEVRGASMMPGIQDRDRILVDQLTYAFTEVERGDVVVLRYPLDPRMDYIKRVVGLPGDEVVVQFGGVWVNGEPVEEPYVSVKSLDPNTSLRTTVQPGHLFVLGDNRIRSSDSRDFGQVPQELVRGLVRLRVWPLERFGWID